MPLEIDRSFHQPFFDYIVSQIDGRVNSKNEFWIKALAKLVDLDCVNGNVLLTLVNQFLKWIRPIFGSSGNSVRKSKLLVFGGSLLPGATILTLVANGRTRQERPTQKRGN